MNFYVPEISDEFRLLSDWTFDLYNESRNSSLMKFTNDSRKASCINLTSLPCIIPAGSVLKIDRVYIRKGQKDFSSITFMWKGMHNPAHEYESNVTHWNGSGTAIKSTYMIQKPKESIRFWAKLKDTNRIEFEKL